MTQLQQTQSQILAIIWEWQAEYKNSPNSSDLARLIGKSRGSVVWNLRQLQKYGYIDLVFVAKRFLIVPFLKE